MDTVKTTQGGKTTEKDLSLYTTPGGGTRSERAAPYYLVPRAGLRRTALRYGLGAEIHGPWNWQLSIQAEETALEWAREAYAHMIEHALKMAAGENPEDDHLGAIGWAQTQLAYIEERYGCRWTDLTKPRFIRTGDTK